MGKKKRSRNLRKMLELQVGKTNYESKKKIIKTIIGWFLAGIIYIFIYNLLFNNAFIKQYYNSDSSNGVNSHGSNSPIKYNNSKLSDNDLHVKNAYYVRFYTPSCVSLLRPKSANLSVDTVDDTTGDTATEKLSMTYDNLTVCYERIHLEHLKFYKELTDKGIEIKVRHEFWELINLISIEFDEQHLEIVKSVKGVKSVKPVVGDSFICSFLLRLKFIVHLSFCL